MHEINLIIFPIKILVFFSIFGGSFLSWLIFPFFNLILLNFYLKFLTLLICFLGLVFGYFIFNKISFFINIFNNFLLKINYFLSLIWFLPVIFCYILNFIFLNLANKYKFFLDLGWIEFLGGNFFLKFLKYYKKFIFIFNFKNFFILILFLLFIF